MRYTHAIVSAIGSSVAADTNSGSTYSGGLDIGRAKKDQAMLLEALRHAGLSVIVLPPEENTPVTTLFVEDVAIIVNGVALVTRPARPSRRKEVMSVLSESGLYVYETDPDNSKVKLEASDVVFTEKEFFVGMTKWTNMEGAKEVAAVFPEFSVTPIQVNGMKHLKHYICPCFDDILAVATSREAQNILKRIDREATFRYRTLTLPNDEAVNCLNINNFILYRQDHEENFRKFVATVQDVNSEPVSFNELCKLGGMLSQHCLPFRVLKLVPHH